MTKRDENNVIKMPKKSDNTAIYFHRGIRMVLKRILIPKIYLNFRIIIPKNTPNFGIRVFFATIALDFT